MTEKISDAAWVDIQSGVLEYPLKRRGSPCKVKVIELCDFVQHESLPVCQNLDSLVIIDEADLNDGGKVFLFVSHRWYDQNIPDDGTLILSIFQFCLNTVIKNNFPSLTQTREVHQSKSLSDKLTVLISRIDPIDVIQDQTNFHRFEEMISSLTTDTWNLKLIKHILSRFYVWIDFCCLPQVHYEQGKLVHRTEEEEQEFLIGLDCMDILLQKMETVILWNASEFNRAWLFYESIMSAPQGTCSFMMPMELIASLSTLVRHYHSRFSELGLINRLFVVETFKEIGIVATNLRDISKIILLMEANLTRTKWKFRIIK